MADQMSAPKRKNMLAGWAADAVNAANAFATKPFGYDNPPVQAVSNFLGVPGLARTLDRISYGEPLTTGKGQTTRLRDDTVDALGFVPLSPKTAAAVVAGGMHAAPGVEHAATVWHGTPHKFDKFDSSKIGTGEGAQAYGHGLYLAESADVARGYQAKLAGGTVVDSRGIPADPTATTSDLERKLRAAGLSWDDAEKAATGWSSAVFNGKTSELHPIVQEEIKRLGLAPKMQGSLYKVDLPDEAIARMLDWDKPLSQQPALMNNGLLREIAEDASLPVEYQRKALLGDRTGSDLYAALGGPKGASAYLQSWKIPGIRYLDGGSRGTGQGTSNFVVFPGEENMLTILERNGQPVR